MFFILDTAERLGFTEIFGQIEPQSPQGKRVKKAVTAFNPDQEEAFDQMTERLIFWFTLWDKGRLAELRSLLCELRSIHGILERLSEGKSLNEGECFEVKANLAVARKIWELLRPLKQDWTEQYISFCQDMHLVEVEDLNERTGIDKGGDLTQVTVCNIDHTSNQSLGGGDDAVKGFDRKNLFENGWYADEPIFQIEPLDELWNLFNPQEMETERFYLWDAYDKELAQVRATKNHLQTELRKLKKESLKDIEEKLGRTVPVSGEIMVSKMDQERLDWIEKQDHLHLQKETFSAYFYKWTSGEKVQSLESDLHLLEVEEEQITKRVLADLSEKIARYLTGLQQNQESLGELDWILAKVAYAYEHNCVPAKRIDAEEIRILRGRHLLVEAEVEGRGSEYTPIDLIVSKGVALITGSNMGGKTLNLRMIGLSIAMAQHGLCVPAAEMEFCLREFIYFSVDDDQTKGDLSTFGQEIVGLNQALPRKGEAGLLLMDELARGTNPEEGSALGRAIIRSLMDSNSITVMTTHFSPLTQVQGIRHLKVVGLDQDKYVYLKQQYNQNFSLKLINQLMDYRLIEVKGKAEVSRDAIRVASLLGLDEKIIEDAQDELKQVQGER